MRTVLSLLSNIFVYGIYTNMFSVLMPLAAVDFGMQSMLLGILVSVRGLTSLLFNIPIAGLADQYGKKKIMSCGIIIGMISAIVIVLFPSVIGLAVGFLLFSFSGAFFYIPSLSYLSIASGNLNQAKLQGINGFIQGASAIVGSALTGFLIDNVGEKTTYLMLFGITIVSFFFILLLDDKSQIRKDSEAMKTSLRTTYLYAFKLLATNERIQMASLIEISNTFLIGAIYTTFLPVYITTELGYSATFLGVLLAIRSFVSTCTNLSYAYISEKFGKFFPVICFLAIGSLSIIVLPMCKSEIGLKVIVVILGICVGLIPAAPNTLIAFGVDESQRALGYAAVEITYNLVSFIIPLALGVLVQVFEMRSIFFVSGTIPLILMALFLFKKRTKLDILSKA